MEKILWIKFGWSKYYRGGPINGNFPFVKEGAQGHEAWNFLPQDGKYYCYTPPQNGYSTPTNADSDGWTVVCLAKNPKYKGIHVVGWYENATLEGQYRERPSGFDPRAPEPAGGFLYSIHAPTAFLVPPEARTDPFSHPSVGQAKYSFLAGPNVSRTENKEEVYNILKKKLARLINVAIKNPNATSAPDHDNDPVDPLNVFGTPEHRKEVEDRSVAAVERKLISMGYDCTSREKEKIGFDIEATHSNGTSLHVEVKGTSGKDVRFFMTRNEYEYRQASPWRIAIVVDALGRPKIKIYTLSEFERTFDLIPLIWKGLAKVPG